MHIFSLYSTHKKRKYVMRGWLVEYIPECVYRPSRMFPEAIYISYNTLYTPLVAMCTCTCTLYAVGALCRNYLVPHPLGGLPGSLLSLNGQLYGN